MFWNENGRDDAYRIELAYEQVRGYYDVSIDLDPKLWDGDHQMRKQLAKVLATTDELGNSLHAITAYQLHTPVQGFGFILDVLFNSHATQIVTKTRSDLYALFMLHLPMMQLKYVEDLLMELPENVQRCVDLKP